VICEGYTIDDRFVVGRLAGTGGMGAVYRAADRATGEAAAVKVIEARNQNEAERFLREAKTLATVVSPAVVRYLSHGTTREGALFLAMEWLEGEDLDQRLHRAGLTVSEALAVARRAAEGLAAAHDRRVIHRDVKPSNIFLVGGDPHRAKLIDFGVARADSYARPLTRTGMILGTAGYMAPEQAIAARDIDARADVFALGCVLFECLAGKPAFAGDQAIAVLAKVLCADVPRLRELRTAVPPALDDLVARMVAKDRDERPADGRAVLEELMRCEDSANASVPVHAVRTERALTGRERRVVSAVLARMSDEVGAGATLTPGEASAELDAARVMVVRFGGQLLQIGDGSLVVTLAGRGSAKELAMRAAACALLLRDSLGAAHIGVATGRAETSESQPVGPAIERAAALLAHVQEEGHDRGAIVLDEVTSTLLGARFEQRDSGGRRLLVGERIAAEGVRKLLGRASPFVGREKELALLEATFAESTADSVARAVLVIGSAGIGKSRLRHELVTRIRAAGDAVVLEARADPVAAGSPLGLARQLVRVAFGASAPRADAIAGDRHRLREHMSHLFGDQRAPQVAELLGDMIGVAPEVASPELRAARNEPRLLQTRYESAFCDWLAAETVRHPLLIVVEDLHWGDHASVSCIEEALRRLADHPILVLALARPEVHDMFPRLWDATGSLQVVRLGGLTRRAAERLVGTMLGDGAPRDRIARVVARADGNAFYLEELIRRVSEGGGDELPETVLAMVQSRLEALEREPRKVLRAASIFGETFCRDGIEALVGGPTPSTHVEDCLHVLTACELVEGAPMVGPPGRRELRFRHGLVREAAYGMLTVEDRSVGHLLAAEWLEQSGEDDGIVMAEHWERGGNRERAIPWIARAARRALDVGNVEAALALTERGIRFGPTGEMRGSLHVVEMHAHGRTQDWPRVRAGAGAAMEHLQPGSTAWFEAVAGAMYAGLCVGDASATSEILPAIARLSLVSRKPDPTGSFGFAMTAIVSALVQSGQRAAILETAARFETLALGRTDHDSVFVGWWNSLRTLVRLDVTGDLGGAYESAEASLQAFDSAGHLPGRAYANILRGFVQAELGCYHEAGRCEREALRLARELGAAAFESYAKLLLARTIALVGDHDAARAELAGVNSASSIWRPAARAVLAEILLLEGRLDDAEREARAIVDESPWVTVPHGKALAILGEIASKQGRPAAARSFAERGLALEAAAVTLPADGSTFRLVRAEALVALGERDAAKVAVAEARDRIVRIAAAVSNETMRSAYCTRLPANARTLELADALASPRE
jgi:tetratricopeptide (TPR) repeat protein